MVVRRGSSNSDNRQQREIVRQESPGTEKKPTFEIKRANVFKYGY